LQRLNKSVFIGIGIGIGIGALKVITFKVAKN